jgi:hypothetical protein
MANSANSYINPTAQKEIADLINKQLDLCDFDFSVRKVTANDIRFNNRYEINNVLVFEEGADPIMEIFEKLSKNRYEDYGQFHHFKSSSIALDIIKNREIQVSSLFSNDKNDFAEYTELYKRIGMFHPLVATDFQRKAFENKINPKDVRPSDIERDHIFVLCLTQDNHNERFWRIMQAMTTALRLASDFGTLKMKVKNSTILGTFFMIGATLSISTMLLTTN